MLAGIEVRMCPLSFSALFYTSLGIFERFVEFCQIKSNYAKGWMLEWEKGRRVKKALIQPAKGDNMSVKRLFVQLMVVALVLIIAITACAPQTSVEPISTASLPSTSSPSSAQHPIVTESPAPISNPFAGEKAWIAYQTNRTGEGIWLVHPDGTEDHQVATDVPTEEQKYGNWSPDGTKLVFTTRGGETEPLYEYDLATNKSRKLFACEDPCVGDDEPVYSPDGTKVAFIRALAPFVYDDAQGGEVPSDCGLWIGDVATGEVTQITSNTNPPCDREYFPQWSPDGSQLTYWRDPYEDGKPIGTAVFVINVDGSNERRLTDPEMFAGDPNWSPDGEWIVFSTYPLNEFNFVPAISDLYRIHPDGTGMEQITHYESKGLRATIPSYTPDGKWIIFTAVQPSSNTQERRTDRSLWIIPAEGGEPIEITSGGIYVHGVWQP